MNTELSGLEIARLQINNSPLLLIHSPQGLSDEGRENGEFADPTAMSESCQDKIYQLDGQSGAWSNLQFVYRDASGAEKSSDKIYFRGHSGRELHFRPVGIHEISGDYFLLEVGPCHSDYLYDLAQFLVRKSDGNLILLEGSLSYMRPQRSFKNEGPFRVDKSGHIYFVSYGALENPPIQHQSLVRLDLLDNHSLEWERVSQDDERIESLAVNERGDLIYLYKWPDPTLDSDIRKGKVLGANGTEFEIEFLDFWFGADQFLYTLKGHEIVQIDPQNQQQTSYPLNSDQGGWFLAPEMTYKFIRTDDFVFFSEDGRLDQLIKSNQAFELKTHKFPIRDVEHAVLQGPHLYIVAFDEEKNLPGLIRINIETREKELLLENHQITGPELAKDDNLYFLARKTGETQVSMGRITVDGSMVIDNSPFNMGVHKLMGL